MVIYYLLIKYVYIYYRQQDTRHNIQLLDIIIILELCYPFRIKNKNVVIFTIILQLFLNRYLLSFWNMFYISLCVYYFCLRRVVQLYLNLILRYVQYLADLICNRNNNRNNKQYKTDMIFRHNRKTHIKWIFIFRPLTILIANNGMTKSTNTVKNTTKLQLQ